MIQRYTISIALLCAAIISSCNGKTESHNNHQIHEGFKGTKVYTCPMHPEIIRRAIGQCPICGMDLVEKNAKSEKQGSQPLDLLLRPTNASVIARISTSTLKQKEFTNSVDLQGYVTYDTRQTNVVSAIVSGRIEKLYVKSGFQPIKKGDKLIEIYSKDLETEQQNLLFLLKTDSENSSLIKAAEQKLVLMGMTYNQVEVLKNRAEVLHSVTIYSPYSGHLHDFAPTESNQMSVGDVQNSSTTQLQIKEGMYVTKGQTIFNIYNTHKVWALLSIPSDLHGTLSRGQSIVLSIDGYEEELNVKIDFVEPVISPDQKYTTARVYLTNDRNNIKIGAIARASFKRKHKGNFLPSTAVVNLGTKSIAFIKENNSFKARTIITGGKVDGWIEIVNGISDKDSIARNGQFLIDSESFIKSTE